jgi:hypothetical protein
MNIRRDPQQFQLLPGNELRLPIIPEGIRLASPEADMSAYLDELIKKLEAEADKGREQLRKLEALTASRRSQEQDTGALNRVLQRLEILKALQNAERDRKRRRRRPDIRSAPIFQPPTPKKAKISNTA